MEGEKEKKAQLKPGEKVRITPELRTPGRVSVNLPKAIGGVPRAAGGVPRAASTRKPNE